MKIIVADDERSSINMFMNDFVIDNCEIEWYCFQNNVAKAIDLASGTNIDLAFLDINMPDYNGIDLAKKLIELNKNTRIVFINGYDQNEAQLRAAVGENFVGLYSKPYQKEELRRILDVVLFENAKKIQIRCFGRFNVFVNGEPVYFESKKSQEILAILVDNNGGFVSMDAIVGTVWADKDLETGKRAYKDNVYRLRKTLKQYGIDSIVEFGKAKLAIKTDNVVCDYWQYQKDPTLSYNGNYMLDYDWAEETQQYLSNLKK